MASGFTPQVTTMNLYSKIEQGVFEKFLKIGCSEATAQVVAHSFTQYVLGYITESRVLKNIVDSGATKEFAESVVKSFNKAKRNARPVDTQWPERHSEMGEAVNGG